MITDYDKLKKQYELMEEDLLKLYRDKAELVLGLHHMTQRYEMANSMATARAAERAQICQQLYDIGYTLDGEGNLVKLTPAA